MLRVEPVIKDYAWGSHEALANLSGRPAPTEQPEAELWVGAHEAGPGLLRIDGECCGLDDHIATDRAHHLGERSRERFGDRLPFLLKILAAEKALSIQAHPDAERAASAPDGVYTDSWPKPEAWVPLVQSEAFAGSLPFDEAEARLRPLGVSALDAMLDAASRADVPEHELLRLILRVDAGEHVALEEEVAAAVRHRLGSVSDLDEAEAHAHRTVLDVHEQFPGDIGVVVLLTMRHHVLEPAHSYSIGAGVLHSFVRGTLVEILANSDNVVRGGLTPKKVDVDELLTIVDVRTPVTAQTPVEHGERTLRYASSVPHFALWEVRPGSSPLPVPAYGMPGLLLAVDAPVRLECGGETIDLDRLECAWWPAGDPEATVTGEPGSRLFVATLND